MIPFFDLAAQQAVIKRQIDQNIANVLAHGKYILGPEVTELEDLLCEYTGARYCITCANGTDALQISLMAIGVKPGDEVITPAFSYIATAEATALLGAKPVYVDVDPTSFNIDAALIEEKLTSKTKAIIPVSLYGQPADFQKINQIAKKHNLIVIEDAAQSFGAKQNDQKSCNLSEISCTSFFPTKPLGCYGDGGAIFTSNENLARDIRQIARHGQSSRYYHERVGVNSRLDTIQAAVLLAKMEILDNEISSRSQLADAYRKKLSGLSNLSLPTISFCNESAWAQFTIKSTLRSGLQDRLKLNGVPTAIHYPMALQRQPAVKTEQTDLHVSESLANSVLSLPLHAYMPDGEFELICSTIIQFFEER